MPDQSEADKRNIPTLLHRKNQEFIKTSVIRPSDDLIFYGVTKTKRGDAEVSIALKLIMEDGSQLVIQYHEINSPMRYDGTTTIELATSTLSVIIKGNNLGCIIDYLAEHRLVWIKAPDSSFVQVKDGEVEIESIEVEEN